MPSCRETTGFTLLIAVIFGVNFAYYKTKEHSSKNINAFASPPYMNSDSRKVDKSSKKSKASLINEQYDQNQTHSTEKTPVLRNQSVNTSSTSNPVEQQKFNHSVEENLDTKQSSNFNPADQKKLNQSFQDNFDTKGDSITGKSIRIHVYNNAGLARYNMLGRCDVKCHLTYGKNNYHDSDVVVFHVPRMTEAVIPPTKRSGQIWVLQTNESPAGRYTEFTRWSSLFNWTMTKRRDADLYTANGAFMTKNMLKDLVQRKIYIRLPRPIQEYFKNDSENFYTNWASKKKSVAWYVSNCNAPSKRKLFSQRLSKFVDIDIYGSCGTYACPKSIDPSCLEKLRNEYKMYASFENSFCHDYITEKSFKIYINLLNTVPIVRGDANYSLYLPPGSYINTGDFKDVASLGKKLQEIADNKQISGKFFSWKNHYVPYFPSNPYCALCHKLHKGPAKSKRLYGNVGNFINGRPYKPICRKPSDLE